jgi:hypothetical protein
MKDAIEVIREFDGFFTLRCKGYEFHVSGKRFEEAWFEIDWDEDPQGIATKLELDADEFTEAVENEVLRRIPSSPFGYDDLEWSNYE